MTDKAEHDICVAELREERDQPAFAPGAGDQHVGEEAEVNFDETAVLYLKNEEGYKSKAETQRAPIEWAKRGQIDGGPIRGD